jgi:Hemerythrin HHE cation binding domain
MKKDMDGPADTSMMGIVHDALRRDLARTRTALATAVPPARRHAIAEHIAWMMQFLHEHHTGEDDGLYPLNRSVNPAAPPCSTPWRPTTRPSTRPPGCAPRRRAGTARAPTSTVPHLERDENEAMPLVSATITHRRWHEWDQKYNIEPRGLPKLAEEGLWLLDGIDGRRRAIVEGA